MEVHHNLNGLIHPGYCQHSFPLGEWEQKPAIDPALNISNQIETMKIQNENNEIEANTTKVNQKQPQHRTINRKNGLFCEFSLLESWL